MTFRKIISFATVFALLATTFVVIGRTDKSSAAVQKPTITSLQPLHDVKYVHVKKGNYAEHRYSTKWAKVKLSWKPVKGATNYDYSFYEVGGDSPKASVGGYVEKPTAIYTFRDGLTPGEEYAGKIVVKAINAYGRTISTDVKYFKETAFITGKKGKNIPLYSKKQSPVAKKEKWYKPVVLQKSAAGAFVLFHWKIQKSKKQADPRYSFSCANETLTSSGVVLQFIPVNKTKSVKLRAYQNGNRTIFSKSIRVNWIAHLKVKMTGKNVKNKKVTIYKSNKKTKKATLYTNNKGLTQKVSLYPGTYYVKAPGKSLVKVVLKNGDNKTVAL